MVRYGDCYRNNQSTGDGCEDFPGDATVNPPSKLVSSGTASFPAEARRPVVLNRPFRSVGELGFVFRDQTFKSLDFWSPTSADSGLLDLFSVTDKPAVIAAQINPNAASAPVFKAIFAGIAKSDALGVQLSGTDANTLSAAMVAEISGSGPYLNRSNLVDRMGAVISNKFPSGITATSSWANKAYAEAPVRALADVTNTRTWNLMIDVVAQTGSFPQKSGDLNRSFVVQGERRYWLHVAIDRFTGEVVSQQLEPVYE